MFARELKGAVRVDFDAGSVHFDGDAESHEIGRFGNTDDGSEFPVLLEIWAHHRDDGDGMYDIDTLTPYHWRFRDAAAIGGFFASYNVMVERQAWVLGELRPLAGLWFLDSGLFMAATREEAMAWDGERFVKFGGEG